MTNKPKTQFRCLIDGRMISRRPHGIARYAVNLIKGLIARDVAVSILAYHDETAAVFGGAVEVVDCKLPFAHPLETAELSWLTKKHSYDAVHFTSFAAPAVMPARSTVTIHDLIHLRSKGEYFQKLYYQTVVRRALSQAKRVITVSEWTKNDLHGKLSVPLEKITVVRNGLEKQWFDTAGANNDTPLKKPFVLCLSNPKPHKNVVTLLKACRALWKRGCDFRLALSLGGEEPPESWKISSGEREKIFLIKNFSDEKLLPFLRHADALVSPSIYEGYDYPAAEALVLGTQAIVSSGSAHDELKGSRLRIYGEPADGYALTSAMEAALFSRGKIAPLDHNIHTADQMVEETLRVYESL